MNIKGYKCQSFITFKAYSLGEVKKNTEPCKHSFFKKLTISMLLSMTGYGRAATRFEDKTITVEIRSLNSKFTDLRIKIPQNYKEKEQTLRKYITETTQRGKIDLAIDIKSASGDSEYGLNNALFKKYHRELSQIMGELEMPTGDLVQAILRLPNVVSNTDEDIKEEEWNALEQTVHTAVEKFNSFRLEEGTAMETDCRKRVLNIMKDLETLDPFEKKRVEVIRNRMLKNMEEYVGKDNIDANRYEQEILYYLEKIDVTEEKVRLAQHCKYFLEELDKSQTQKGRKLSFISQEMGREINTLGSKANSSDIQRIVVRMKDELEKIKELVANSV